ncbi:hypothetical protein K8I61_18720 [bacterium]|nr:hypothetical protein [bacterium]
MTPDRARLSARASDRVSLALAYLLAAAVMLFTYRGLAAGHFQAETDVIRAGAARGMAEWLPYLSRTAMMINGPAIAASGTVLPGVWMYHVLAQVIAGPDPGAQLAFAGVIHLLAVFSAASLLRVLFDDGRAAFGAIVVAVAPVLGDVSATYANGPALLSLMWIAQAGLCYARFARRGGNGQLFAATMCVFLAVSTDPIGFFAPFLVAGVEAMGRPREASMPAARRVAAVFLVGASAVAFIAAAAVTDMPFDHPFGALADGTNPAFKILIGLKGLVAPGLAGKWGSISAILFGTAVLLAAVYRGLEDARRLVPVALFFAAVLVGLDRMGDPAFVGGTASAAFLCPVLVAALIAGDLFRAIKSPRLLALVLAAIVGYGSTAATLRMQPAIERGERVERLGDDMRAIYDGLSDESDIYLVGDGVDDALMLTAHLDFVYRHGLSRQTRFSYVDGGRLMPADAGAAVGRLGPLMRLAVTRAMVFIGWTGGHTGLTVLNNAIDVKRLHAEDAMSQTGYWTDPFPMGGADAVENWQVQPGPQAIPPGENYGAWYLEGPIIRLHPGIGRRAYA